jgi:hypothetical protein
LLPSCIFPAADRRKFSAPEERGISPVIMIE